MIRKEKQTFLQGPVGTALPDGSVFGVFVCPYVQVGIISDALEVLLVCGEIG